MALRICNGNMEEGALRCDVNVSVRKKGETILNPRTEIKNLNSFKSVESAIEYEIWYASVICTMHSQIPVILQKPACVLPARQEDSKLHPVKYVPRGQKKRRTITAISRTGLVPVVINDEWLVRVRQAVPESAFAQMAARGTICDSRIQCGNIDGRKRTCRLF